MDPGGHDFKDIVNSIGGERGQGYGVTEVPQLNKSMRECRKLSL